jgi:acetyltransferase
MALVAVDEAGGTPAIIGVARYIMGGDQEAAEFAVVVADAWHGRGVGWMLMTPLVACAKARGLKRLEGTVLRSNHTMLNFTAAFGFVTHDDPEDGEQVTVVLDLAEDNRAEGPSPRSTAIARV